MTPLQVLEMIKGDIADPELLINSLLRLYDLIDSSIDEDEKEILQKMTEVYSQLRTIFLELEDYKRRSKYHEY